MMRSLRRLLAISATLALTACSTLTTPPPAALPASARWAVLPFTNTTETPLAGQRAASVAAALLPSLGASDVQSYPERIDDDILTEPGQGNPRAKALEWARAQNARYALTGTVQEWRYKVGVDGEPVAGVAVQIIDLTNDRVVWSAVGARSGWSRDALSAVAQQLLLQLLKPALARQ